MYTNYLICLQVLLNYTTLFFVKYCGVLEINKKCNFNNTKKTLMKDFCNKIIQK